MVAFIISLFLMGSGIWTILIWNSLGMKCFGLAALFMGFVLVGLSGEVE